MNNLKRKNHLFIFLAFNLIQITFFSQVYAQAITVNGKVTTPTAAVQNSMVTFEDNNDTTRKYSTLTDSLGNYRIDMTTTAIKPQNNIPTKFDLAQNYPNPFSSSTAIPYALKKHSKVYVTIYDLLGREVRKIDAGVQPVGSHRILWDGCNNFGQRVATGIYLYRLEAGGESKVRKMIYSAGGNGLISLSQVNTARLAKPSRDAITYSQEGTFTVRIENTSNTSPLIVAKQIDNVFLQNDTTLNFTVSALPVAKIYTDSLKQYIRGFGAANILPWRPDMTDSEIQTAFGTGDGQLGFSILRLRLPSSTGWDFSIQAATAKKAYDMGVLVFASPWSPPAAFKSNNNTTGGYLLESHYQDFVDHLNSFIDYMEDNGVSLYAVSVQNEPDIEVSYESCDYTPEQMKNFMAGYAGGINTKVIAPESFQFRKNMSDPILNDSAACANLDIVGGHIYGGGLGSYPLAVEKGKELWMTEHLDTDTTWSAVLATGKEINDCMNVGMNAYVWWYLVRFYGPILEDGNVSKRGYVMSQYARFVRPGFYRIKCNSTPQRNIYVTSYKDDSGKVVIVALNTSSSAIQQTFTVTNGIMTAVTPYTTSQYKKCEQACNISVSNGTFTATLDASNITTFVSN